MLSGIKYYARVVISFFQTWTEKSGIQIPTQRAVCPRHEITSQIKTIWPHRLKYKALNNEAEAQTDG